MSDSTSDAIKVDTARLPLLLNELRLPTIAAMWQTFTERADREAWPAARLLATLAELELAERSQRRIQRHLIAARLPPGKTLDNFDFTVVPMVSRAHVSALVTGDGWIDRGGTILLFGPSGSGKSHLCAASGHALIENGYRVLFTRTTDLVQRLQQAAGSRDEVFALFPILGERRASPASRLSGGQQQMLAIGRALMGRPDLLMMDEPSLGLASLVDTQIFEIVIQLAARGVAILLVEQNVGLALEIADYAYGLENGRIVVSGPAEKMLADPRIVELYLPVAGA